MAKVKRTTFRCRVCGYKCKSGMATKHKHNDWEIEGKDYDMQLM